MTYGEYQANENDKKFETEEMTVKTWKFILDDGTPMKALTTFKNGKSMDLLIGAD